MKTFLSLIACFFLLVAFNNVRGQQGIVTNTAGAENQDISLSCSPGLNTLVNQWVAEYGTFKPGVKINVMSAKTTYPDLLGKANLAIVTRQEITAMAKDPGWKIVIGHDVVVPVINEANPYLNSILQKGITNEIIKKLLSTAGNLNWGTLAGVTSTSPIHLYIPKDGDTQAILTEFIQDSQLNKANIKQMSGAEIVAALQKDPLAIGFCKTTDLMNAEKQDMVAGIRLYPIDKNANGTIDPMENIYGDLSQFMRGMWIGKYPKGLVNNLYAVSNVQPSNQAELDFLRWVISDGQNSLKGNGFSDLIENERESQLVRINAVSAVTAETKTATTPIPLTMLLVLGILIVIGAIITVVVHFIGRKATVTERRVLAPARDFAENALEVPKGLHFDKTHTWAFQERDGNITVGIDDFLQHATGPVTRVVMRNAGEKVRKGDLLFSLVQQGKQLKIYAPVSGTVKKHNDALLADPKILNTSPYDDGWVCSIEPTNWFKELQLLDTGERYKIWLSTEFSRFRDFLAAMLKPQSMEYSHVVLQDGGVIKDGVLAELGPEAWEDFQTYFLDETK